MPSPSPLTVIPSYDKYIKDSDHLWEEMGESKSNLPDLPSHEAQEAHSTHFSPTCLNLESNEKGLSPLLLPLDLQAEF